MADWLFIHSTIPECWNGRIIKYNIRYRSDTYLFGWVSVQPEREYFCHSQLQRDWYPWDLYTIWTKGNTTPYYISSEHLQFDNPPGGGGDMGLYAVETGKDFPSPFCVHRDRAITYDTCSIDYAGQELSYSLSFLDPTYPFHRIKGTAYFEGTSNKAHELWVNGAKKCSFVVQPGKTYNFEALIPRNLYETAHKVNVSIKSPNGSGVYLAGLQVFRLTSDKGDGGPQSFSDVKLESKNQLSIYPNPFSKLTNIYLNTGQSAESYALNIYDISGCLVKSFRPTPDAPCFQHLSWDGCDDKGKKLPSGIYIVESKSATESITEKVILLR